MMIVIIFIFALTFLQITVAFSYKTVSLAKYVHVRNTVYMLHRISI